MQKNYASQHTEFIFSNMLLLLPPLPSFFLLLLLPLFLLPPLLLLTLPLLLSLILLLFLLLQALKLQSFNILLLSTYYFHLLRSWIQLIQFFIFNFFMSFLMSFSHLFFGLSCGRIDIGFQLHTFFTILSSAIRCKWPN